MASEGSVRTLTDLFFRRGDGRDSASSVRADRVGSRVAAAGEPIPAKAFRRFLAALGNREAPVLLDLGPIVGSNVSFLGERLGCKIFIEDLFSDLDRFARTQQLDGFPEFLNNRLTHPDGSVDGILCWDLFDYLDKNSARQLAERIIRMLRPDGALLGFFGTVRTADHRYSKFMMVDDSTLERRCYDSACQKQAVWLNRDILRLFEGLRVSESFLLKINTREMLFRKPA